jgi:hypothetical protein
VIWHEVGEAVVNQPLMRASPLRESKRGLAMPLSHYALDNYVAPRLSELRSCGAEPLPEPCNFLNSFILTNIFQMGYPTEKRSLLFNFIRRVEQAFYEYDQGRTNLLAHVEEPRSDHIAIYFRALAHFEQCVAVLYQASLFWKQLTGGNNLFTSGDGSFLDRVNKIYNVSHHMDERIVTDQVLTQDPTTQVWLLNDGIACNEAKASVAITFTELRQELMNMREAARYIVQDLPGVVHQGRRSSRHWRFHEPPCGRRRSAVRHDQRRSVLLRYMQA